MREFKIKAPKRIRHKWVSCGHRQKMALICFYLYADGARQAAGYICTDCLKNRDFLASPLGLEAWTWKAFIVRSLDAEGIGALRIVFARVAGAEQALPDEVLMGIPADLESRKLEIARRLIDPMRRSSVAMVSPEQVIAGIGFAAETNASPESFKRAGALVVG